MSVTSLLLAAEFANVADSVLEFLKPRTSRLAPDRGLSATMRTSADEVLAAVDRSDLIERLDELAVSGVMAEVEASRPSRASSAGSLEENLSTLLGRIDEADLDRGSLMATLGATPTRRCEEGFDAFRALLRMLVAFVLAFSKALPDSSGKGREATATDRDKQPRWEPLELLYDSRLPVSVRAGIGRLLRSLASAYTIARAEEKGEKLEPWLGLAVAELFAEGLEQALLAAQRAASDPASLVMLGETSRREREQLEHLLDGWRRKASAAGGTYMSKLGHEAG